MRTLRVLAVAAFCLMLSLWVGPPASASTCAFSDPSVEEVVCPVVTTAGKVLCKVKICLA